MTMHTNNLTGTFNKSYTHTSLMAGAIGRMPTMLEEGEIDKGEWRESRIRERGGHVLGGPLLCSVVEELW